MKSFLAACILGGATILSGCAWGPRPLPPAPPPWEFARPPSPSSTPPKRELGESPLPLRAVVEAALVANPGLHAAELRWQAARNHPRVVTAFPDPTLTLSRYIEEVVTRNGPIRWNLALQQRIPLPPKLVARGKIAEQAALMAWEDYVARGLAVIAEVKKAYYELYWEQRAIAINQHNLDLLQQLVSVAQTKYAAGQVTQQDVLKAQIEVARVREQLNTLGDLESSERARLNRILDRPPDAALGSPAMAEVGEIEPDLHHLYDLALGGRPAIERARREVARSKLAEDLARWDFWPDFSLSFQYSDVGGISLPGATDAGQDAYSVGIGVSLPIWWGARKAALRENHGKYEAARQSLQQLEEDTRYEVTRTYYQLQIALRNVRLYRDNLVPQAQQALDVSETAYSAVPARVDFESVIGNEQRLLNFQITLERARADFQQHMADLEAIVGRSITEAKP